MGCYALSGGSFAPFFKDAGYKLSSCCKRTSMLSKSGLFQNSLNGMPIPHSRVISSVCVLAVSLMRRAPLLSVQEK